MVAEFVPSLVDRIVKLIEIRQKLDRTFFTDHIEPIHKDLRVVHENFRAMLVDSREKLLADVDTTTLLPELRRRREERLTLRRDARLQIHVIGETARGKADLRMFCETAIRLLVSAPHGLMPTSFQNRIDSPVFTFLESFSHVLDPADVRDESIEVFPPDGRRDELIEIVELTLERIDANWSRFSTAYLDLRLKSLR